jgi:hypothetical protein
MPITQARITLLLEEHESNLGIFSAFLTRLNALSRAPYLNEDGRMALKAEIDAVRTMRDTQARIERRHFDSNARRNERTREAMRLKRRAAGVPERDSAAYRTAAYGYAREALADAEYNRAMGGKPIGAEVGDLQPREPREPRVAVASPAVVAKPPFATSDPALDTLRRAAEKNATTLDKTPEELEEEALRGTVSMDDVL